MTQVSERAALAGWPALLEAGGETVSYTRVSGGSVVSGFPLSLEVVFFIDNKGRREYEDGRGDLQTGVLLVGVGDLGSEPRIGDDAFTRADATVWVVKEVKSVIGGVARCECARYTMISHGGRRARVER